MSQEEIRREMEEIMRQLSPNRQRYLLELARASKKAECYLDPPPDVPMAQSHTKSKREEVSL